MSETQRAGGFGAVCVVRAAAHGGCASNDCVEESLNSVQFGFCRSYISFVHIDIMPDPCTVMANGKV